VIGILFDQRGQRVDGPLKITRRQFPPGSVIPPLDRRPPLRLLPCAPLGLEIQGQRLRLIWQQG
jgi:hypothetical protein